MKIPKLLLVDNTGFHVEAEKSLIAVSPVQLLIASDGEQALQIIREKRPDLVIMDAAIPGLNGVKCCAAVKSDPDLCLIPVLIATSIDSLEDIRAGFEAGCDGFISKPLDKIVFLEKVRTFLPVKDRPKARVNCQMQVAIEYDGISVMVECCNLTLEGMFVKSKLKTKIGSKIGLSFNLPGQATSVIKAKGRVAWTNNLESSLHTKMPIGFGIEIDEITGEGHPALRKKELVQFIKANEKNSIKAA